MRPALPPPGRLLRAGATVAAAFIPMFARRLARGSPAPARAFAGEALWCAAAELSLAVALLELAVAWLVRALAPGFGDAAGRLGISVLLMRVMLPFVLFAALAQLLGGMLNGLGRFAAAVVLGARLGTPAHALA